MVCELEYPFTVVPGQISTVSMRQQEVPAELFGRVNSAYRMLGWGTRPFVSGRGSRPRKWNCEVGGPR